MITASGRISPKLEARECQRKGGYGVYAREYLQKGELLIVWGGEIITRDEFQKLKTEKEFVSLQIEEDFYLISYSKGRAEDCVNHSCNPNAGLQGQIILTALRDILPDEEICYDYAMSDGSNYDEFECRCGASACRKIITGSDWRLPELWTRYEGYFSPYLQRRIRHLQQEVMQTNKNRQAGESRAYLAVDSRCVESVSNGFFSTTHRLMRKQS